MRLVRLAILVLYPAIASAQMSDANQSTVIVFVRHAEVDPARPDFSLNAAGQARALVFARTVGNVAFSHVFSSHTTRARQMVEPVAKNMNLEVRQLPAPGVRVDSGVVSDRTPSKIAIAPLTEALRQLPPGSVALVGVNSDNIYAILNGLGVPLAAPDRPCAIGATCVPCLTNACAQPRFDQFWVLTLSPGAAQPKLIELRYGVESSQSM